MIIGLESLDGLRMIGGGLEEDWRRIGEGLEEDWRRIGGGWEEDDLSLSNGGGVKSIRLDYF